MEEEERLVAEDGIIYRYVEGEVKTKWHVSASLFVFFFFEWTTHALTHAVFCKTPECVPTP
jgi:hypothetical protein